MINHTIQYCTGATHFFNNNELENKYLLSAIVQLPVARSGIVSIRRVITTTQV